MSIYGITATSNCRRNEKRGLEILITKIFSSFCLFKLFKITRDDEMDYLKDLNIEQLMAVEATEGYVQVIAGAGSGKTKTLTSRLAYLIEAIGIAPDNILCVTFTNKAAKEMQNRIKNYLGELASGALIMTFGALAARIIREDGRVIGYPANYQIIDEDDKAALMATVLQDTKEEFVQQFVLDRDIQVKRLKNEHDIGIYGPVLIRTLEEIAEEIRLVKDDLMNQGYNKRKIIHYILLKYVYEKRKSFAADFSDLSFLSLTILRMSEIAREKWQDKLKYMMVDEYQDVSDDEVALITILQGKYHNLFIVGDSDQTIYSFRGSRVEYILDFAKTFHPAQTILLNKNYRSGANILDVSNRLIQKNQLRIEKDLLPNKSEQGKVIYFHAKSTREEANFIVDNIQNMHQQGLKYNEMAILYRAHHVSRAIEESLLRENIPYRVYSGIGFYQRKEIKDILAYMRLLIDGDDLSFSRVINYPRRQMGPKALKIVSNYAEKQKNTYLEAFMDLVKSKDKNFTYKKKQEFAEFVETFNQHQDEILSETHPISDLMMFILEKTAYEDVLRTEGEEKRLENLAEFKQSLMDYEQSFEGEPVSVNEYLQNITLLTSQDVDDHVDKVNMMTVHTSKGLEFPVVYVCGLSEGIFPSSKIRSKNEMEEERRLAYVAYTRAEKHLILTDAEGLTHDGADRYPSRFIFDAERVGIEYLVELSEELLNSYGRYRPFIDEFGNQSTDFEVGDTVKHKIFGLGEVLKVNLENVLVKFESKSNPLAIVKRVLEKEN